METLTLTTGWQFRERPAEQDILTAFAAPDGWLPAAVPGTVHQDLLAAGRISDPFAGLNEQAVQWVGERDWLYRCAFDVSPALLEQPAVDLCFDGLDTFAAVWLNGSPLFTSDNMFVPQRVAVKDRLQTGQNELFILFESAWRRTLEREAEHGPRPAWNPNPNRLFARKAQYHFGWDWGPVLITAGVWRTVRLEASRARIADLHCPAAVAADLRSATLPVTVAVEAHETSHLSVRLELRDPAGVLVDSALVPVADGAARHTFTVADPALWWPNGSGTPNRYTLSADLLHDGESFDRREQRLGLRRLRLVQEPLANDPGTTFLFEINNQPVFCGGANWIPADSFTPRVTPERYRAWLTLAADANMNMLRIWGGGIYEDDVFYDLCDELGLMIWQDFMFACGLYPAYPDFLTSVRAEAEANVKRLRHHPCIVLWCGNNEDYQIAEAHQVYDPAFTGDHTQTGFPARAIYEGLLPEVCAALDPTRPYWPGSPYSGDRSCHDPTIGDRHSWEVWHGPMLDYHDYRQLEGRFVSEFGMQSYPARATIDAFTAPDERYTGSRTLDWHNKAAGGVQRLAGYIALHLRGADDDLNNTIYASQLIQAEAVAAAYSHWRRRWGGPGQYAVSGALVWQLDDCWPVISWALVDSELRPKPAYYVTRRKLAPLTVEIARVDGAAAMWAVNAQPTAADLTLDVQAWTLDGQPVYHSTRAVSLPPCRAAELGTVTVDTTAPVVIGVRLLRDGVVLARAALWPEPFKYYAFPQPTINLERQGETLRLTTNLPVKGLWLAAHDGAHWSDNLLDLLPDDAQIIHASGLGETDVTLRWLGSV